MSQNPSLTNSEIRELVKANYRKRAKHYNFTANLYYLIGYLEWSYRKRAIAALGLKVGDTVVEIGCGTGMNFGLLQKAVGAEGRIIGVDLTDAMLNKAQKRVHKAGWTNVQLINKDAVNYQFPEQVDGILSTFAISFIPECAQVIERGCDALVPGGRWAIADMKMRKGTPDWMIGPLWWLVKAFIPSRSFFDLRPWLSIREVMKRRLIKLTYQRVYMGFSYITSGERERDD